MTKNKPNHEQPDLTAFRQHIAQATGQQYWRSLEELAGSREFEEHLHREFPRGAAEWIDPVSRRNFLKLMGASLALAGVVGCTRQPSEKILPYTNSPENVIPGVPQYYATSMTLGGYAKGLLVESHTGRPTKVEGNPAHPASLGATDAFAQASILTLYDPDRSQTVLNQGQPSTWESFVATVQAELASRQATGGQGIRLLTEAISSPTLIQQVTAFLGAYPGAVWHQYEPMGRDNAHAGAILAFGEDVDVRYELGQANLILTLDADILTSGPGELANARAFASKRRVWETDGQMSRLYAVEATPSSTGSMADHRLAVRPSEVEAVARLVAQQLGIGVAQVSGFTLSERETQWITELVADLQANQGTSVVIAGDEQPPIVHLLAHVMNDVLGNVGKTVTYTGTVISRPAGGQPYVESLRALVNDMDAGRVDFLVIISGNPVFTAPADLDFAGKLQNVAFSTHLGLYNDETAALCRWHIPEAHFLESWSDARSFDGTVSIVQPLIAPLFGGKTAHELIGVLNNTLDTSYNIVRGYWASLNVRVNNFEHLWQLALSEGLIRGSATAPKAVKLSFTLPEPAPAPISEGYELIFRPDPAVWDGRFANNAWLQELPRPLTKLVWDNAAWISPRTAIELFELSVDIENLTAEDYETLNKLNGRVVELVYSGRTLRMPVWIVPGHPNKSLSVSVGYGHTRIGNIGNKVGFNAYSLRTSDAFWFGPVEVKPTRDYYQLVTTQIHHAMEGRGIVRAGTLEQYRTQPDFVRSLTEGEPDMKLSLFRDLFPYEGKYSWGMSIDLNTCTECNACVVACQAENNIPVVGKDEVNRRREMHWLRIDRYYGGSIEDPVAYHQPLACVHCEKAPCEIVCPVVATVHDEEGLNSMIYNRCVGTKYCSNNCPYKVRRFNFFQYNDETTPTFKLMRNPDVTVRSRGVMEKCTYCVQRIRQAEIQAKREGRVVQDGEVTPACAQACSTGAIVFGNLNDPNSQVNALKAQPLTYTLLGELNFYPRTSYLGRLRNLNPAIEAPEGEIYEAVEMHEKVQSHENAEPEAPAEPQGPVEPEPTAVPHNGEAQH